MMGKASQLSKARSRGKRNVLQSAWLLVLGTPKVEKKERKQKAIM